MKMRSYINVFLKTEITPIPQFLNNYMGKYYNNSLCNGAMWMFLSWYVLHVVFDASLDTLFRRMKYREYTRVRLRHSLWYLGFYTTACVYFTATMVRNNSQIFNFETPFESYNNPGYLALGFIPLVTFYLHSVVWELLQTGQVVWALNYLCLFLLMVLGSFSRFVESTFRLTILICYTQISLELARCAATLIKRENYSVIIVGFFFTCCIVSFVVDYIFVVPLLFVFPLVKGFSPVVGLLLGMVLTWLTVQIYDSVPTKAIVHWLNHKIDEKTCCNKDIFECSLFPPRNDVTYNLLTLQQEMREREEKSIALRKPNNRSRVMQTLKCMVTIKRKLKEKRLNAVNASQDQNTAVVADDAEHDDHGKGGCTSSDEQIQKADVVGGKLEFNIQGTNKCKRE